MIKITKIQTVLPRLPKSMLKDLVRKTRNGVLLSIVMDGHGAYESVTVWTPYNHNLTPDEKFRTGATCYSCVFGDLDIIWSWRSTYRMLDRKTGKRASGFYTGKPLKSETFIVTTKTKALKIAKELYNRKTKVHKFWRKTAQERNDWEQYELDNPQRKSA